jgi:hypothetical protein
MGQSLRAFRWRLRVLVAKAWRAGVERPMAEPSIGREPVWSWNPSCWDMEATAGGGEDADGQRMLHLLGASSNPRAGRSVRRREWTVAVCSGSQAKLKSSMIPVAVMPGTAAMAAS